MNVTVTDVLGSLFNPTDTVCFRVFDDKKDGVFTGAKLSCECGKYMSIEETLKNHNIMNRGVFFVVNFGGQDDDSITRINAQFVEMDNDSFDEQQKKIDAFPLPPSMVIKTQKSYHVYWFMDSGAKVERFRMIQTQLVKHFDGDPMCVNESRVMRLPGFMHCKKDTPVEVTCVSFHPERKYTQDQLSDVLPEVDLVPVERKSGTEKGIDQVIRSCVFMQHCRDDAATLPEHDCGDSTKQETYELLMSGKLANLVVTDPPYNVNYEGSAGKIKNDNLENEKFYQFLFDAFTCMEEAMANDASIYVFHADTEGLNFRKAFADAGFYLSGTCIWKKQSLVLGRSPYQWQHEPCLFGWKKNGKHQWYSDRKQTTIWEFDKPKKNGDHPTMKPIPLIAYPIKNSSMSNCIVLDPFGGSGSTLIACEQTNRICHTIELDEKFCDVIVKRYIEQVGSAENVSVIRDGKTIPYSELEVADED